MQLSGTYFNYSQDSVITRWVCLNPKVPRLVALDGVSGSPCSHVRLVLVCHEQPQRRQSNLPFFNRARALLSMTHRYLLLLLVKWCGENHATNNLSSSVSSLFGDWRSVTSTLRVSAHLLSPDDGNVVVGVLDVNDHSGGTGKPQDFTSVFGLYQQRNVFSRLSDNAVGGCLYFDYSRSLLPCKCLSSETRLTI